MPKRQTRNYQIKYNFDYAHQDFQKVLEEEFLKFIQKNIMKEKKNE